MTKQIEINNKSQLHNDNKMLLRALSFVSAGFAFFAVAFYYKVDDGLKKVEVGIVEQAKTNAILSVAISQIADVKKNVEVIKDDLKKVEFDVRGLQVRVGHLEDTR